MAVLCGMPTMQYWARSARLSLHQLFTSCIRRGLVSRDSIVDGDCGVIAAWSRKKLKILEKGLRFSEKRPLTVKFSKFCSESFHRNTNSRVVFKFREIWPSENLWNRALLTWQKTTKFRLALQLSLLRGWRPKSARASPQQCTQSAPDFIQIGPFSTEL